MYKIVTYIAEKNYRPNPGILLINNIKMCQKIATIYGRWKEESWSVGVLEDWTCPPWWDFGRWNVGRMESGISDENLHFEGFK